MIKRFLITVGLFALIITVAAFQNQNFSGSALPAGLLFSVPTFTISGVGSGNGILALAGTTSGTATFTAPSVAGTATNPVLVSNTLQLASGDVYNWNADTGLSRSAAGLIAAGNGTAGDTTALLASGNKVSLSAPFTDANASGLQAITGLSFALGTVARNWSFHCSLTYSEATPIASDQFGVASLTTSPTNLHAWAHVITTEGATAAQTTGDSGNITNTTPTSIVTFTPVGTGVKQTELDGTIEAAGSTATTLQFYVANGTAADVIVIARDSYCVIY
jgi:hypothetical protein